MKSKQTDNDIKQEQRKVSSRHIKDFRKNVKEWSQEELAENIGVDTQTIGRYERMECSVSNSSAEALAQLSGYIKEYWLGLTECKTEYEYMEECLDAAATDQGRIIEYQNRKREKIKKLFELCGFGYEDFNDGSAAHDFIEFSGDEAAIAELQHAIENKTPHKITDYSKKRFNHSVYLSDDDLTELTQSINGLVGYFCYMKEIKKK